MQNVNVDEALWTTSIMPEGTVVRWFVADGATVGAGNPIAELRIEDALHEISAPITGRLHIVSEVNNVIEPGTLLATLDVNESL